MIGERQTRARRLDRPALLHAMFIDEQANELRTRNRGMRVVELNRHVVSKTAKRMAFRDQSPKNVLDRRGREEVLLLESQFLAQVRRVIRIEDPRNRPRESFRCVSSRIVAAVEALEIKELRGLCRPKPQGVGPFAPSSQPLACHRPWR